MLYEVTQIETITQEYDQAKANYSERLDKLQKKQATFKKDYKSEIEVYKKVVDSKGSTSWLFLKTK